MHPTGRAGRNLQELADVKKQTLLMLAACMLVSLLSFDAEALPGLAATAQHSSPNITLVRGFCGLGFHREYRHSIRNGAAYVPPVVVTPHVVVTPQVVVDARIIRHP